MKLTKKRAVPSVVEMKIDEYNKRFGTKTEKADGIQSSGDPSSPLSITIDGKPLFELYPGATLDDVQAFLGSLQKGQSPDAVVASEESYDDTLSGGSEYEATLGKSFRDLQQKLKAGVADKKLGKSNVGGSLRKLIKRTSAPDEKRGDDAPLTSAVTEVKKDGNAVQVEGEQVGVPDDAPTKPMISGETKAKGEDKVEDEHNNNPASAIGWLPEEEDDDVYMDPNIEAVRQDDDIIIGFYDRTPQDEEHEEGGFDLGCAAYNLSLAIDGAIVKTLALGASGMELFHSFLVNAKCGEKDRALEAPKEDPAKANSDVDLPLDAPAAASDLLHEDEDPTFVGDAAEEPEQSLIHPMILEKLNEFTEQIKSATVQSYATMTSFAEAPPCSDAKNAEPINKGTDGSDGTDDPARQMHSYSCDALAEASAVENLSGFVPSCSDLRSPESIDINCIGSEAGWKKMALPGIPPVCPAPLDDSRNDCVETNHPAAVSGITERQGASDEVVRAESELEWVASEDIEEAERLIAACVH